MFRIVEDQMPPLPDECSDLAREFLTQCFNKDPSKRPSAELLFEHPWLKQNWGFLKVNQINNIQACFLVTVFQELRPKDSIPFLRRVSADLQKSEAISQVEVPDPSVLDNALRSKETSATQLPRERHLSTSTPHPLSESDISPREHSFVKTTFSKRGSSTFNFRYLNLIKSSHDLPSMPVGCEKVGRHLLPMQSDITFKMRPQCAPNL